MSRLEFLNELKRLLYSLPLEEREEAIKYYEDYFEDAGPEKEQEIINELGSPKKIADSIRAELNGGIQRTYYDKEAKDSNNQGKDFTKDEDFTKKNESQGFEQRSNRTLWIVLFCILFVPVGIPILAVAFSLIVAIAAVVFGVFMGTFFGGIGCIFGGIVAFVFGLGRIIFDAPSGIFAIGSGLVVFGVGLLLLIASLALCIKVLPAIIRLIKVICRKIFWRKREI